MPDITPEQVSVDEFRAKVLVILVQAMDQPLPTGCARRITEEYAKAVAAEHERAERLARQVEAFKHAAGDIAERYQGEVATLRRALDAVNGPIQLWNHAEACVTGTGCTHDSDSDCADSLLHHAANLMREASREGPEQ